MPSRRDFLKTSAAVGGSVLVGAAAPGLLASAAPERAPAPMRFLILGGTGFIGPHLVKHSVGRGHTVSIFTRGRSGLAIDRGPRSHSLGARHDPAGGAREEDALDVQWKAAVSSCMRPPMSGGFTM